MRCVLRACCASPGLRVLVYPDADKIGKQIKYADSLGIPFVAILGGNEIAAGTVTVKNLTAQTQATYDQSAAARRHSRGTEGNVAEQLGDLTRTHTCGALRTNDVGADVVLLGWVHRVRDLGGVLFIDVRDRGGVTQVVFDKDDEALMNKAKRLRSEYRRRRNG